MSNKISWFSKKLIYLLYISVSSNLMSKTESNEIGSKLDKQVWEDFLKTGIILANFISVLRTIPDVKEVLKIISSGFDRTAVFKSLRISKVIY